MTKSETVMSVRAKMMMASDVISTASPGIERDGLVSHLAQMDQKLANFIKNATCKTCGKSSGCHDCTIQPV